MESGKIVIYQTPDGQTTIDVRLEQDTVWLTQAQIVEVFHSSKANISEHIKHIYDSGELEPQATVRNFRIVRQEGKRQVTRELEHYNLDMILSIGYRVNSKRGTQFRIWANKILKDYLINGYTLNEKRLNEKTEHYEALKRSIQLLENVLTNQQELTSDEATGLLKVITDYTYALDVLDKYDHRRLTIEATHKGEAFVATYGEAKKAIEGLRDKFGGSSLFGNEKDESFRSSMAAIYQSFGVSIFIPALKRKRRICCISW